MSFYDKINIETLANFYFEIHKNIKRGILSERMYQELDLIQKAAENRGLTIFTFYQHSNRYKHKKH